MKPVHEILPAGEQIHRIYDPSRFAATATGYRYEGPHARMDHHVAPPGAVTDRGIFYGARTFRACLVEVIDDRMLTIGTRRHVVFTLRRSVRLLDLRGVGAMAAGIDARIGKCAHEESQPWARHFYDDPIYQNVDGFIWLNSHTDDEAIAFLERAGNIYDVVTDVPLRSELQVVAAITEPLGIVIDFATVSGTRSKRRP